MFKSVNGCMVHYTYRRNEQTDELPVLFLHGWGCDTGIYAAHMDALGEKASIVALDFPAHGESDEPPRPWGVGDFADQVAKLLETLEIQTVDIVAHSFGARVAVYLAAHQPERVRKLVITGGAGLKKPADSHSGRRTARYKRLSAVARAVGRLPLLKTPMKLAQERLIQKYGSKDYAALSESMRPTFVKIIAEDLTPLLKDIVSPTLLIWGENDEETPLWMGRAMERAIPDAGLVVFEGRSHYAFLEESARFLTIVRQFFWGGAKG